MEYFFVTLICAATFVLSLFGTKFLIQNAETLDLIDVPNERSSHHRPTPRGGGLAFGAVFFVGILVLYGLGYISSAWVMPIASGGPLVALIGWLDDRRPLSAGVRILIHFTAALLVYILITKGFALRVNVTFVPVNWPVLTFIFCLFFVVWMLNLYNFMDGIDGLAGTNALVTAFCLAGISAWQGALDLAYIYLILGCSVLGFLVYNWSPAKIFMGDSGSTLLGFGFATLALTGKVVGGIAFFANITILGFFIVDATYTLLVRLFRGKKIYQAHRDHAFQHAVQMGWSHQKTVLFYSAVTLFWLFPLGIGALVYENLAFYFLVIAYIPLIALQIYFKAGLEGQLPERPRLTRSQSRRFD